MVDLRSLVIIEIVISEGDVVVEGCLLLPVGLRARVPTDQVLLVEVRSPKRPAARAVSASPSLGPVPSPGQRGASATPAALSAAVEENQLCFASLSNTSPLIHSVIYFVERRKMVYFSGPPSRSLRRIPALILHSVILQRKANIDSICDTFKESKVVSFTEHGHHWTSVME